MIRSIKYNRVKQNFIKFHFIFFISFVGLYNFDTFTYKGIFPGISGYSNVAIKYIPNSNLIGLATSRYEYVKILNFAC